MILQQPGKGTFFLSRNAYYEGVPEDMQAAGGACGGAQYGMNSDGRALKP